VDLCREAEILRGFEPSAARPHRSLRR